ncbi:MAG: ribonuclease T [Oleiphilaceae bacterium]
MSNHFDNSNSLNKSNSHAISDRFRGFLPVVIDVETAGFNSQTDALLEIAAVIIGMRSDGGLFMKETVHCNVEPFRGANLEQSALDFTGIDPKSPFRNALTEIMALDKIFTPIRKAVKEAGCTRAILVGHNAHFDHSFVFAAAERTGIKRNPFHQFSSFDTTTLSALAFGQTVLAKSCGLAGVEFDGKEAHSAKYDTEKTAELFCRIVNKWRHLGGWPL